MTTFGRQFRTLSVVTSTDRQGFCVGQKKQVKYDSEDEAKSNQKNPAFAVQRETLADCERNRRYENSDRREIACKNRRIEKMLHAPRNKTHADSQKK